MCAVDVIESAAFHSDAASGAVASCGDGIEVRDAKTSVGNLGNQDFSFIGGNAISAQGQVRVFIEGTNTIVQGSNDGDLLPEFEIQLTGTFDLAAGDFIL